jgi:hypothetical protein
MRYLIYWFIVILSCLYYGCSHQSLEYNQHTVIDLPTSPTRTDAVEWNGKRMKELAFYQVGETFQDVHLKMAFHQSQPMVFNHFVNILAHQVQLPGIVDVESADYMVRVTFHDGSSEQFYLWYDVETFQGAIMSTTNTSYMYQIDSTWLKPFILQVLSN